MSVSGMVRKDNMLLDLPAASLIYIGGLQQAADPTADVLRGIQIHQV